jgi:protein TonB
MMTTAVASPDEVRLPKFIVYSLFLHGLLAGAILASIIYQYRGNAWAGVGGGSEGSVSVSLTSGNMGIPMPQPPEITDSKAFDPTNGLYKAQPQPEPPAPPKDATPIPKFEKDKPQPKPIEHPSKVFEKKTPAPDNAVNYGKGGRPQVPTGYGQTPGSAAGGVAVQGQGGGDFASRYGWYIEAVRRRVNQNWLQTTIDPAVRAARTAHCTTTFTIYRDGTVKDVHMAQTSGNLSMDNSAQRALLSSSPMPGLPSDYSGSYVNVTFDFDLSLTR